MGGLIMDLLNSTSLTSDKKNSLMNHLLSMLFIGLTLSLIAGCVDHRPIRNGLRDESVYVQKNDLTQANPKLTESEDSTWLYRVNVVRTSSPNITDAFPGNEGPTRLVNFRFREDALQVVDAMKLQDDDPEDINDDVPYTEPRVI